MRRLLKNIVCATCLAGAGFAYADSLVEAHRASFRAAYPDAELGIWQISPAEEQQLKSYVLWPDLRAAWLRASLGRIPDAEVAAFLARYGTLKPARELRYRYALRLAAEGRLADYLRIYRQYYQGLALAKLDCLALQAEINAGHRTRIANLGGKLWLTAKSQVDECDPVFDYLRDNDLLTTDLYRERFQLAISARNFSLARYLAKSLDEEYQEEAAIWLQASRNLQAFAERHARFADSAEHRERLLYAVERVALRDPAAAKHLWQQIESKYKFSDAQRDRTARHVALWSARRHHHDAADRLNELGGDAVDAEVLRWRVRTALRGEDLPAVVSGIRAMGSDEQDKDEWQYWLGIALRQTGNDFAGTAALQLLADTRSYYGFLAADEIGADYAFSHDPLQAQPEIMANLQKRQALTRARELFLVGLDGRGRSEWDAAIALLNKDEMVQAAILAHSWGWHSRAIATAARTGNYDDLDVRYPMPWAETFARHATEAQVRQSWAYGVARSESLFMRDVRSHAGAVGLMQLLPETGRATALETNQPYAGLVTLVDPEQNIRLGTNYLAKMYQRFDKNHVLATAAYNAGPLNVEAWLPADAKVDARIWIENIPYNETRGYVRRVLSTDAIFHWRLTGEVRRISSALSEIEPANRDRRVAQVH